MNVYIPEENDVGEIKATSEGWDEIWLDFGDRLEKISENERIELKWRTRSTHRHEKNFVHIAEYRTSLNGNRKLKYSVLTLRKDGSHGGRTLHFIQSNSIRSYLKAGQIVLVIDGRKREAAVLVNEDAGE